MVPTTPDGAYGGADSAEGVGVSGFGMNGGTQS